jgi:hypothetical protein
MSRVATAAAYEEEGMGGERGRPRGLNSVVAALSEILGRKKKEHSYIYGIAL